MTELKNVLSLPLLLLSMGAFVSYDEQKSAGKLLLSWLCFLAAMLCKSSVVMFPVVLFLYCWWKRGRIGLADVRASAAFFGISLVLGLVEVWYQQHIGIGGENLHIGGISSRLASAGMAVVFYLWKFLVPVGLMPAYPRWAVVPPSPAQFLPWLALGALFGWLWTKRASWGRDVLFGLGCFGVSLLPVMGLIPMAYLHISWVADHFVYLPMLGLIGLVAGGAGVLADRLTRVRRGLPAPLAAFATIVLCALGVASHRHAAIFRDAGTLWGYELEQYPQSWVGHNNLGYDLSGQPGREAEAIAHYETAIRLEPDSAQVQNNLGYLLASLPGRQADAIVHYEAAVRIRPDYAEAHCNLAYLLASLPGREADAIAHYETAIRIKPDFAKAHNNLAHLLAGLPGRQADALAHYEIALRIRPDYAEAHNNLGLLLASQPSRQADAIAEYQAAIRLTPDFPEAHNNLGILLANEPGRQADALAQFETALRIRPDYAEAHNNLANLLSSQPGRQADAIAQYETAIRLRPDYANAHYNLAVLLASQPGREADAIAHYEAALPFLPNSFMLHYNLALQLAKLPGRQEDAVMHLKAALKIYPDFALAKEALQRLQSGGR
jgi:tetratricopeptide (TPR) repeat protein